MKKTFFSILCLGFSIFSYSQDIILPSGNLIGFQLKDNFTYQGKSIGHYSIGWNSDPWHTGANTLWQSGYGGIKLFTQGTARLAINKEGNIGIGTESPTCKLEVNGDVKAAGNFYIGQKGSLSNGNEVTRISIVPYAHTGGTWNIISRDNPSMAFLDLSYGKYDALSIRYYNLETRIGIGVKDPQNKLDVNGTIRATEVKVETGWADFVFDKDYKLPTLQEVENHINEHKHLPDIPSEAEVKENGVSLGEMQAKLLQKIEELTLYTIELNKTVKEQGELIQELKSKIND